MPQFTHKTVTQLTSSGAGIFIDGQTSVIIPGAQPGDIVSGFWQPPKAGGRWGLVESFSIDKLSSNRSERCPIAGVCGGCPAGLIDYDTEIRLKTLDLVSEPIARLEGKLGEVKIFPTIPQKKEHLTYFRNKVIFYPFVCENKLSWGYFEARSHNVINAHFCAQNPYWVKEALEHLPWDLDEFPVYNEKTLTGVLRGVLIREGSNQRLVAFILKDASKSELLKEKLTNWATSFNIDSLIIHENPNPGNSILSFEQKANRIISGSQSITTKILGLTFNVGVETFLQVNTPQTETLYKTAIEALNIQEGDSVWDLYCGVGTISLILANMGASVLGVDKIAGSIECAKQNARINRLEHKAQFVTGLVEDVLGTLKNSPTKAILDPAFKGLDKTVPKALAKTLKEFSYISCNPKTFIRDALLLKDVGFELQWIKPVDMFPGAWHLELVGYFKKKEFS